jgi:putative restriction endonuclease
MPIDFTEIQLGDRYDRPALARLWGYQGYEALSRGVVVQKDNPNIVLFVTRIKQTSLTNYKDYISGDRLYWEGEEGHQSDNRIASASKDGKSIHLFYREIHHTLFEYKGALELLTAEPKLDRPSSFVFRLLHDQSPIDDLSTHAQDLYLVALTEREAITKARLGQGKFREALLETWRGCSVTGLFLPAILKASHIKPWRASTNAERLDPYNGLLLLPQYDALFDAGLITFSNEGSMLLSRALDKVSLLLLGVESKSQLRNVHEAHKPYLSYHRLHIFVK